LMGPNLGIRGLWRRWEPDKITMIGRLNSECSPTALPASQTVTKQQAEGVFVLDQRALRHIGLYTAKPLPQRIESDQGHSRDNASDANLSRCFSDTCWHVRGRD
jgi:hypothetical protein